MFKIRTSPVWIFYMQGKYGSESAHSCFLNLKAGIRKWLLAADAHPKLGAALAAPMRGHPLGFSSLR